MTGCHEELGYSREWLNFQIIGAYLDLLPIIRFILKVYFAHDQSRYFDVGKIKKDQVSDSPTGEQSFLLLFGKSKSK